MARARVACWVCVVALCASGSWASAAQARSKKGPTVLSELTRLRDAGVLTPADYAAKRAVYKQAKAKVKRLRGARKVELGGVVGDLESMAARRKITASRVAPLWLTLEANLEWWTTEPLLAAGQRVTLAGSQLVWQHYLGHGIQIQWLGTFGKLNALWRARARTQAGQLLDEALALASSRAGGVAWEYLFPFDGQRPPWVSSLAQGTGLQAMARTAAKWGRGDVWPILHEGLGIFERRPPQGVRVDVDGGAHYLQYSGLPRLQILNGFVQSLVGLFDYATLSGDPTARALFASGDAAARVEVPRFDTGAWSLYSRGSSKYESSLPYHELLRDFLTSLCDRTSVPVYCDTAERFTTYLTVPPVLRVLPRTLRAGKLGTLRFRLSKVSRVSIRISRAGKAVYGGYLGTLGYGTKSLRWLAPRRRGAYEVQVSATDLAGNTGSAAGTIEVKRKGT